MRRLLGQARSAILGLLERVLDRLGRGSGARWPRAPSHRQDGPSAFGSPASMCRLSHREHAFAS